MRADHCSKDSETAMTTRSQHGPRALHVVTGGAACADAHTCAEPEHRRKKRERKVTRVHNNTELSNTP
eukprot:13428857-Alexandrium_andersonii.AAC.1